MDRRHKVHDASHEMLLKRSIAIVALGLHHVLMSAAAQTCGTWARQPFATAMAPRAEVSIAYDQSRRQTVTFGGYDGGDLGDTWAWNGTTWTQLASAGPTPRRQYAMAFDSARGLVVMYGGVSDSSTSVIRETWLWNGTTWTQSAIGPVGAQFCSLAYDVGREVVVHFGGYGGQSRGETWEFAGGTWTQRASSGPPPRYGAGLVYDSVRRHCVLFGGVSATGTALRDTWVWDGVAWTQRTPAGEVPPGGFGVAMAFDEARGQTVLFGGQISAAETWSWDGSVWTRRSVPPPLGGNSAHSLAYDRDRQRVVLFGGTSATASVWEWDGVAWAQRVADPQPIGRQLAATAYDSARQRVILFGGNLSSLRRLDDTWARTSSGWTELARGGPAGRSSAGIAYDDSRDRIVLFGGFSGVASLDDTWEFDGVSWSELFPAARPAARLAYAMAYDAARRRVVMFGGERTTGLSDETWSWDGTTWSLLSPTVRPSPRRNHSMAFDPVRQQVVMFGGLTSTTTYAADTWVWDGVTWRQLVTAAAPAPRSAHQLAFESSRGRVVLVGGQNASNRFNDTWELDDSTWRNVGVNGPIARSGPSAAFDQARGKVIVFGGVGSVQAAFSRAADTWEYAVTLPSIAAQPLGVIAAVGTTRTITVDARNAATFAWRKGGTLLADGGRISGSSTASLRIQGIQPEDAGNYAVTLSNECGSLTSSPVTIEVVRPPSILTHPAGSTVVAGAEASFSVVASGDAPLTYQWLRDGQPLAAGGSVRGVQSPVLQLSQVAPADAGTYAVRVTNSVGTATSTAAPLTVLVPPVFTMQPSPVAVLAGRDARFRSTATGSPAPSLQWFRDGSMISNDARVSGVSSAELSIRNVTPADAGSFVMVASNIAGTQASQAATLSVGTVSLEVTDVSAPSAACLGSSFTVQWTGRNAGTMPAESGWNDRVIFSANEVLGDQDDRVLGEVQVQLVQAGGASSRALSVTIPEGVATGSGFIFVASDPAAAVFFNDRTRASGRSQTIDVRSPRLVVAEVSNPSAVTLGSPLAVAWTDRNSGTCPTPSYSVGLVLSRNAVRGDADDMQVGSVVVGPLSPGENARRSASPLIPASVPLGSARLFVVADPSRSVPQDSRVDAEAAGPEFVIGAPDLVVQSLTPPPNVLPNTSVQLAWSVTNVGTAAASGPWTESITGAGPPGSLPLGSFAVPAGFTLQPGQSVTRIQNVAVPGIPPGNGYSVSVCVDSGNAVAESAENNNCRTAPVCVDCAAPDLRPVSVAGPSSGFGFQDRPLTVTHVVRNAGNGAASGTWLDRVFLSADTTLDASDVPLGDVSIAGPLLSATEYQRTSSLLVPASVPAGEYHLLVSTDVANAVSEPGNEANNVAASIQRVRIGALPNLRLSTPLSSPDSAVAGDVIRIAYAVQNAASVDAAGPWNDAVYLSADATLQPATDARLAVSSSPVVLSAGGTYERAIDVTLPPDFAPTTTRYLLVRLDDGTMVDEANELDNVAARAVLVSPTLASDLAVTEVTSPAAAAFGGTISLAWTVANQGEIPAVGAWSDSVVLSINSAFGDADDIALSPSIPGATPLPVGGLYQRSGVIFSMPPRYSPQAAYRVLVRTGDPANVSPREANRANNVGVGPEIVMTPTPSPNLRVTEVVAPSTAVAGVGATLRWTVSNAGTAPASGLWTDRVLLRDPAGLSPDVELGIFGKSATVAPDQSYTQQFAVTLPREIEGGRVFVVTTDSGDAIAEPAPGAEADNVAVSSPVTSVALPQGPDLVVTAVQPLGGSGTFGAPVSVQLTVRNQGTLAATGAWFDRVLLRRDGANAAADLPLEPLSPAPAGPLAAGAEYTVTAVVTPPVRNEFANGAYRFVARADANGNVVEQREGNNEAVSVPFTLVRPVLPNLRVNFVSAPAPALPGAPVTVTWTVVNAGGARVQGVWAERLFVSSDAAIGDDTLLSTISIEETLEPGQVSSIRSRTVPAPSAGLSYRMVVCTDVGGAVVEESESDNCAVSIADSSIQRSDLTVRDVAAVPLNVMADDLITVSWIGENVGAAVTPGAFVDVVTLVDVATGTRHVLGSRVQGTPMQPGVPEQRVESYDVPGRIDGDFRVEVSTDAANAIVEVNEADNTATGALEVSVTQPLRPNLVVSAVQPPASGVVGSTQTVGFTVTNTASVVAIGSWLDRVVARNVATGVEQDLAIVPRTSPLAAGASYAQSVTVRMPQTAGDYLLCVTADSGDAVNEGLAGGEGDNRRCAEAVFRAQTYIVTAVPSITEGVAGTPVTVTGVASATSGGDPIPNLPVALSVNVRGTVRTYADSTTMRTDASGAYSFVLPLLASEAGQYALRAGPPGNISPAVQASFVLHGLRSTPSLTLPRIAPGAVPVVQAVTVTNTGDLPLTGLAMSVAEAPPGLEIAGGPSNSPLLGQESRTFNVAFSAGSQAAAASGRVRLAFATAQGAVAETSFNAEIAPLAPQVAVVGATPVRSNMLVHREGESPIQTNVEVRVVNRGGSPTGPIAVQLPAASWLGLATPSTMASLAPGEEAVVVLTLTPGRNLLNADPRYPGTFQLRYQTLTLSVPFEFTAVATATSSLIVRTEDESTFYKETPPDPFPPVRGAFVRVVRPDGNIVMASGLTDANGEARFDDLPEGDYYVEASADRHQPWRELVPIRGSQPVRVYPFLSFNAISYSWNVDPIQIEDRYRFTLEAIFETNVPFPVVDIEPRVIDLDDYADGQPHQVNFTLTNRGQIRAQQVQLTVGESSDWIVTTLNGEIGNLSPGRSVTVPAIIQRRPPACPTCTLGPGCSPPVTGVRHVVRCRGDQVLEQVVAYRLQPCGSPTGLGGGSAGGGGGGGGGPVVRTPQTNPVRQPPCGCVKLVVFNFSGGCGDDSPAISEGGGVASALRQGGLLRSCVRTYDIGGSRCASSARALAVRALAEITAQNRRSQCCVEQPLVVTVGTSWGSEAALNPVGINNVRQIVIVDGIAHATGLGNWSATRPSCVFMSSVGELAGYACRTLSDCDDVMPRLQSKDGSGPCPYGLNQRDCVAALPSAAQGAVRVRNVHAMNADACAYVDPPWSSPLSYNHIVEACLGSQSLGFEIEGVEAELVPSTSHCNVWGGAGNAVLSAVREALSEVPTCESESNPCP